MNSPDPVYKFFAFLQLNRGDFEIFLLPMSYSEVIEEGGLPVEKPIVMEKKDITFSHAHFL